MGEIPLGQYSCKKYLKKKKKSKVKKEKLKVTKGLLLYHFQADLFILTADMRGPDDKTTTLL